LPRCRADPRRDRGGNGHPKRGCHRRRRFFDRQICAEREQQNGYDLAARLINDEGGIKLGDKAYKLVLRYDDDESTPARRTRFMLGPYSSRITKAILPVIEKHKVPMIEANGGARELFAKGCQYIFAVLSTSDQYLTPAIDLAAEHAADLGKTQESLRVALAIENDPFAQDVRAGVLNDIERHGMQVVIDDQLPPELNDMSMTLAKIKALKPDVSYSQAMRRALLLRSPKSMP
jgi:branched-chain amino acid transport system substrate-binding protein